jgi:hypothetical protein
MAHGAARTDAMKDGGAARGAALDGAGDGPVFISAGRAGGPDSSTGRIG